MPHPYRVVVAETDVDGPEQGVERVARSLRDAGFEVIFVGRVPSADLVAAAALQEDADAVGPAAPDGPVADALARRGLDHVVVFEGQALAELPSRLGAVLDQRRLGAAGPS